MTDAGGTSTLTKVGDWGQVTMWRLRNTSVDTTETMPVDITGSPVAAEDQCIIIGGLSQKDEKQVSGNDLDIEYDETNRHFTITQTGCSSHNVDIYFLHTPQVKIDLD